MESIFELASKRRSIRKYENTAIPAADLEYFIKTAVTAPSGCNSQCWEFVAVTNRDVIDQMAGAVRQAFSDLLEGSNQGSVYIERKGSVASFFENAPLVIAVFMTRLEYYDPIITEVYEAKKYDHRAIMNLLSYPDALSVGAAIQNLLLAVEEKGYGACWMNEPALAGKAINHILGVPDEHLFMSMIPVGVPAYRPREKKMKEMSEVFRIIE